MTNGALFSEAYFRRLVSDRDELLLELEREADREEIPIIGPVVGSMLQLLALSCGAAAILELGTATGYSGLYLARACAELEGLLVTLEYDPEMAKRARSTFARAGVAEHVRVVEGEAVQAMQELEDESFDLAFLDIDKEYYRPALKECGRLLRHRGILVADNTSFPEAGDFNSRLYSDPGWRSVQLLTFLPGHSPEKDGLCLAVKTRRA